MAEGKIIKFCAECGYWNKQRHKCSLGHNKEDNPRDHFYDDCTSLEDLAEHDKKVIADFIENGKGLALCDKCDYFVSVEEAYKNGKEDGKAEAIDELERLLNLEPFNAYVIAIIRDDIKKLKEKNNDSDRDNN